MKLIRCKKCNDVVRLVHTKWRQCDCGKSGGQYNDDLLSATIGGNCEVIGIRNDFFECPIADRVGKDINYIIQGEYLGDYQIQRIISPKGPKLKMLTNREGNVIKVKIIDRRKFLINLKRNPSPKTFEIPFNETPSFKDKPKRLKK